MEEEIYIRWVWNKDLIDLVYGNGKMGGRMCKNNYGR